MYSISVRFCKKHPGLDISRNGTSQITGRPFPQIVGLTDVKNRPSASLKKYTPDNAAWRPILEPADVALWRLPLTIPRPVVGGYRLFHLPGHFRSEE